VTVAGNPVQAHGINSEGLRRRKFSDEAISAIKRAYKTLYKSGLSLEQARVDIQAQTATHPELQMLTDFLASSERGIVR
jgi:UDP-N-acetylglucosamine acyltransferase